MRIIETVRERIEALLTAPREELGRWARFWRYQIHLWRFCLRRLREHNAAAMSAALSFRTVFAMVPALVVALLVMKPLGMTAEGRRSLRELLDRGGFDRLVMPATAPATGPGVETATQPAVFTAADKIQQMVDGVSRQLTFRALGPVGAVLLIW